MYKFIIGFLAALLFASNGLAKSPPPGTGFQDIPTNVLIMLDTSGSMDEDASAGDTDYPFDVTFDSSGNKYVASYNSKIEKYDSSNNYVTDWGSYDYDSATNGLFRYIYGIDIDSTNKIYVADYKRGRIQVFNTSGTYLSKWSIGTSSYVRGIAIYRADATGATNTNDRIYVVDDNGDVLKYNASGTLLQTWSSVNGAYLIAVDSSNRVYISKTGSDRVYKYDTNGTAVNSFSGNNYFSLSFDVYGIEVDGSGNIYLGANSDTHKIYKYNSSGVFQQSWGTTSSGTSLGKFKSPKAISMDRSGNVWVADSGNDRIQKVDGTAEWPGDSGSRLDQAKQVIKDIVSNSTLTDGANFGLMKWNSSATMLVPVSSTGASTIYSTVDSLSAGGGTYLDYGMNLASSYLLGSSSPMTGDWCQNNLLIVISDGEWVDNTASSTAESLYNNYGIKTFVVGFTVSDSSSGAANYITISQKGGTYPDSPVFASNWQALYESISDYILQTISSTLTFSTPTIMPEVTGTDHIIQATFKYKTDHQWKGHLNKYSLDSSGLIGSLEWDAGEQLNLKAAANRDLWTVGPGLDSTDLNNFRTDNLDELRVPLLENSGASLTDSQLTGLIDFIRGVDSYSEFSGGVDDEGDAIITGERWKLADVYHSRATVVGVPSAYTSESEDSKTEAYYRFANDYNSFKTGSAGSREAMVYVGSNGGMLHAFKSSDGDELWGFIPPSIMPNFKDVISSSANKSSSIYGVDGSPVAKDIYYGGSWKTVLMVGSRQGGNTYSALDVTDPTVPLHMFTFANNTLNDTVSYWDSTGVRTDYSTADAIPSEYDYSDLGEAWSQPLILRLPVGTAGAMKWTAVFGGGFNNGINPDYGARLFIIDLEDGGKIINKIAISDDDSSNGIVTSVPPRVMAVTPDSSTSLQGSTAPAGAVIYFSDLEGKLWKINLTNQGTLYETSKLFDAESSNVNTRYTFHENVASMDANGNLWQYYGTGDQQSLGDVDASIANRAYGFKHSPAMTDFSTTTMSTISNMANVAAGSCPSTSQDGWYINLDANEKITAKASVKNGAVYFSRYTPDISDVCSSGSAKITEHDYTCGSVIAQFDLGYGVPTEAIVHNNKIYLGISTDQTTTTLPAGWVKQGNLIIGTPTNEATGTVKVESWWEDF